jgi:Spy/CpxP family protein refolding chaperone
MNKKIFILFSNAMLVTALVTAQPQPPKPPSDEEKLKHVSEKINKEITLTAAQKAKVEAAYKDFFIEMEKLRKNNKDGKPEMPPPPPPPPPGKKEDVDKLSKARDAKIKAALSEAQFKKYSEIEQTLRPPRPGDGKQGPPQQKP